MTSPRPSELLCQRAPAVALMLAAVITTGCQSFMMKVNEQPITPPAPTGEGQMPNEMSKVTHPTYRIGPPDLLIVEAVKIVPKPPYKLETFDIVLIAAELDALPTEAPLQAEFSIDQEGNVDLGSKYGKVSIVNLTVEEATEKLKTHLRRLGHETEISVSLTQIAGHQTIAGQVMVTLDGTINLGKYGPIHVAGLTLKEAERAIEAKLSDVLQNPQVSVTVAQFLSQTIWVITEGAGLGDNVLRLPVTGNETVLDAISAIRGIPQMSSHKIWVARPTPGGEHAQQLLPVDWDAIVKLADTSTNWQLMPDDRLFISADPLATAYNRIDRTLQPADRAFGFALLGTRSLNAIKRFGLLR